MLEKTLESPLDSKIKPVHPKGNQSWISLEGLMLKLKFQSFGHLMQRTDSSEKRPWCGERLKAGEGDNRGWDGWMASPTQWTWVQVNSGSWRWTGRPGVLQSTGSQSQTQLSDWTDGIGGEIGYTAQEDLKSVRSYNMQKRKTIRVWFFHSCILRPSLVLSALFIFGSLQ